MRIQPPQDTTYKLREVNALDSQLLFEWVNDYEVRKNSIISKAISWTEHETWFKQKVNSDRCKMFILETNSEPVGQVRFDYNGSEEEWEIDYSLSKKFRGQGLAKVLLSKAIDCHNRFPIVGYVKENNKSSCAAFISLGFIDKGLHKKNNLVLIKFSKALFDTDIYSL